MDWMFSKQSDTLNTSRKNTVLAVEASGQWSTGRFKPTLVCRLSRSDFHFINDNAEWLQMDKAGHIFLLSFRAIGAEMLEWSGASQKSN
jgi:hypothetical protein